MTSIAAISPLTNRKAARPLPLSVFLQLQTLLKKSIFSRKLYDEISTKVLASSATVDTNLYFICYFTLLLSSVLNNKPKIRKFLREQRYNFMNLINKVTLLFGTDLKQSSNKSVKGLFEEPQVAELNEKEGAKEVPSNLAVHLKAISSYISDIRIFNRLTDSIKYMPWIIDEYSAFISPASAVPKLDRFVNLFQSINCLVLELLENAGWLTEHNWVGTNDNDYWCLETYVWCSRVWAAYVIIEILELIRRTPFSKWDKNWRILLFKQAIQIPLVVHWSMYEGCLSPFWVGVCGSGASWFDFKNLWGSIDLS
ncbi:uncharacterized protein CANTADRAFT_55067 [Suhomyces tanzawaensis NRRL Y-17324]|uniref:Uncharacterized protein n=1 Tax=Suhomyces tanzawaensis NRRL Y-17324 TaxID=984487 RepID=A0A1E4SFA9_9ASCO|nr:uncharacterized protein CANTADRAFT_55067 [Suhomyces tanzawaensis NRRL Y-17324]ODV78219.1 hypothetical protein CANTADRAFT_55067 [Suhomyces tanzawaensis NRRL Y-17324]